MDTTWYAGPGLGCSPWDSTSCGWFFAALKVVLLQLPEEALCNSFRKCRPQPITVIDKMLVKSFILEQ